MDAVQPYVRQSEADSTRAMEALRPTTSWTPHMSIYLSICLSIYL